MNWLSAIAAVSKLFSALTGLYRDWGLRRAGAKEARLVAVVSLSASSTMIGLIHSQPPAGALILAQAAIKFIVTKSVKMGSDFGHPFGPGLSSFEGSQTGFPSTRPA